MVRRVAVVPHTHWDREWYEPFQSFRMRLVGVLDDLLDLLERDPSYQRFLLDGQMAVVDDYLEVRPEAGERVRALVSAGRLEIGPWYILMDEHLVSGETIVRNLQLGLSRAAEMGGAMNVGYLPDMFGHVAQMPQILALAGIGDAVVWRGVPSEIGTTAFRWEAPDGSAVRAEYLVAGYSNGALVPEDADALLRRLSAYENQIAGFLSDGEEILFMNGTDHEPPQPWLGAVVAEANQLSRGFELRVSSISEYLAGAFRDGLPRWQGELRSGFRSNVLMGVSSNRVDVKLAKARAEMSVERLAEPLSALLLPAEEWPGRMLDLAWREIVRNSAHDSICACSVDAVVDTVVLRFAEAAQIGNGLAAKALDSLADRLSEAGPVVLNPSARSRGGVVEAVVPPELVKGPEGERAQVLSAVSGLSLPSSMTFDAETVETLLGMIQSTRIDDNTWVQRVEIVEDESGIGLAVTLGSEERHDVPLESMKQDLLARIAARPASVVRVNLYRPATTKILARVAEVPGFGWVPFEPAELQNPVTARPEDGGGLILGNGLVTVALDPSDGTFAVDGIAGFGRLVDGGDGGDSYNYCPPVEDRLVDSPVSVALSLGESGPVRATARITALYRWPERVEAGRSRRSASTRDVEISTTITLLGDDPAVRVATSFTNPCRDHRLRVHLPLPEPAIRSEAETAFGTVSRGLEAEGRADELGLPTFPSLRFITAGGLTVAHEGLCEYELVDIEEGKGARAVAITLLRATGMLSGVGMSTRPLPAGPLTPVEGLQLLHRNVNARYALSLRCEDPYRLVDDAFLPLRVLRGPGGGIVPQSGRCLSVTGAEVSSVRRNAGRLEVRVFNPRKEPAHVEIAGRSGWTMDLRGRPVAPFEESFDLRPSGIATVLLTDT